MTGWGVERLLRAANQSPSLSPAEASTPLPPPIQGAERRWTRRGLSLLVVGGLAGAAWLLTGAAAQAADRADEPSGSLPGAVLDGDVTAPVPGLLTVADQPLEASPAPTHHVADDVLEVPHRVLARPADTIDEVTPDAPGTDVDIVSDGVGTLTSGSGAPTEGSSAAFLPIAIADRTAACQLMPFGSDVEVRRHDAEAPTVSPD